MSYLDPKERVIDLRLTSYGRHLLAIGKLKPTYYAFFDDDVIYDGKYAAIEEERDSIEPRIQEGTPRFAAQAVFSSREKAVFNSTPNVVNDLTIGQDIQNLKVKEKQSLLLNTRIQEGPEQTEILQQPIGKSNSAYTTNPAWQVKFLKKEMFMSGSSSIGKGTPTDYLEVSGSRGVYYRNIPQLEANIEYQIIRNSSMYNQMLETQTNFKQPLQPLIDDPILFLNGGSLSVARDKSLIIRLEESNTFFEKENFEIECFEIETIDGKENLIPLNFFSDPSDSANDPTSVGQYIDIIADEDIPLSEVCHLLKKDKVDQFFHTKIFDCEEFLETQPINMYTEEDDSINLCPDTDDGGDCR